MKAVNIEVTGMPLNEHELMWTQEYPNGLRASMIAPIEFAEVIMNRMRETHAEIRRQEAAAQRGVQGI